MIVADNRIHTTKDNGLSDSDIQILLYLSNGKRHDDIAQLMASSIGVTRMRISRLLNKMGCNSACGAIGKAFRTGIIK